MTTLFRTRRGNVKAVDDLDLVVNRGEIVGIVGESGCGKSTVLRTIMGLVSPPGRITEGQILFEGRDLLKLRRHELRDIRGRSIAMIFQDPLSSLNPAIRVGAQIREVLALHRSMSPQGPNGRRGTGRTTERERVIETMTEVGIADAGERFGWFPHEFSGGMQQRALIAMGLVAGADLLLADEPTTALDVTIQAQIVDLLRGINRAHGTAIVLVTHDLGLAAEFCDRVAVMYAGRVVEQGPVDAIVSRPRHPYTRGLLRCLPQVTRGALRPIPGNVPDLADLGPGCAFADRCPNVEDVCRAAVPTRREIEPGWQVACNFPTDGTL